MAIILGFAKTKYFWVCIKSVIFLADNLSCQVFFFFFFFFWGGGG